MIKEKWQESSNLPRSTDKFLPMSGTIADVHVHTTFSSITTPFTSQLTQITWIQFPITKHWGYPEESSPARSNPPPCEYDGLRLIQRISKDVMFLWVRQCDLSTIPTCHHHFHHLFHI